MGKQPEILVIHVAKNPLTGVWSSMCSLIEWQVSQDEIIVATAVFPRQDWPKSYRHRLELLGVEFMIKNIPNLPMSYVFLLIRNGLARWIEDLEKRLKPKRIAVHFHNSDFAGIFVPLRPKVTCPFSMVTTFHGMPGIDEKFRLRRPWQRWLHRRLQCNGVRFASVDAMGVRQAQAVLGYDPKEFVIIPNGLAASSCVIPASDTQSPLRAVFIGSIDSNKGWEVIVEAVLRAREQVPIELVLAGTGVKEPELQDLLEGKNGIRYLGYVEDAANTLIPDADILILASKVEGLPMVILEAMSKGVVVISTAVGAIPEVIRHGEEGFLVERNSEDIRKHLVLIAEDRYALTRMKHNVRKRFEQNFDIRKIGQMYSKFYFDSRLS